MMNTDFDGDQLAVFLPVTEAGQREAAERLTVAAQLTRDPELLVELRPRMDALLGLTLLSLTPAGRAEIDALAGTPVLGAGWLHHALERGRCHARGSWRLAARRRHWRSVIG